MRIAVLLAAVLAIAACGDPDAAPSTRQPDALDSVVDDADGADPTGAWVLTDGPVDPISGWDVTVTIEGDQITGKAACNGYGGSVAWGDGEITVTGLGWTEMGCEPEVQALEQTFLASLVAVTTFDVAAGRLELVATDSRWTFERLADVPTADLVGTTWVLDSYLSGDSVSNEPGMESSFIELAEDGTVVGATNCRELSGTWTESGAEVFFNTFAADGECADDAEWDLDGRIVTVLGDGFRPAIDGDRLTVTSQGDEGLSFRAGERPATPAPPAASARDREGGVDGPVAHIADRDDGEEALLEAELELDGQCLFANYEGDRSLLLWPFGTVWQAEPPAVVSPRGWQLPIGGRLSAAGGFHGADGVSLFTENPAVGEYVERCGVGDGGIFIVQHPDFAAPSS